MYLKFILSIFLILNIHSQEGVDDFNADILKSEKHSLAGKASPADLEELKKAMQLIIDENGKFRKDAWNNIKDNKALNKIVTANQKLLSHLSDEELKSTLLGNFNPKIQEKINDYPKATNFIVKLLKDDAALPGLLNEVQNKKKIQTYLIIIVLLFIIRFIISRKLRRSNSFILSFIGSLFISIFFFGLTIGAFYFVYEDGVAPVVALW